MTPVCCCTAFVVSSGEREQVTYAPDRYDTMCTAEMSLQDRFCKYTGMIEGLSEHTHVFVKEIKFKVLSRRIHIRSHRMIPGHGSRSNYGRIATAAGISFFVAGFGSVFYRWVEFYRTGPTGQSLIPIFSALRPAVSGAKTEGTPFHPSGLSVMGAMGAIAFIPGLHSEGHPGKVGTIRRSP